MRKLLFLLVVLGGIAAVFFLFQKNKPLLVETKNSSAVPTYKAATGASVNISVLDEDIPQVSHLEITPDGSYLLVGTLPGTIWIYHKVDGKFRRQVEPFFVLKTSQPGFPPQEAGLTGIALGADFQESGDIFLTYSFAFEKKSFRNRVARVTFAKQGDRAVGINPQQIFEANTPGTGSHQIQDGVGVLVGGKPHFLFSVGEGFVGERALDPLQEAGKLILIQRDGSPALGTRPFPQSPKIQVLGIRNAPAIAQNPINGKIAIADTGPNNYDRFIYGTAYDAEGDNTQSLSFHWDGKEESLKKGAQDLYDNKKEMILYRWAPTETAVNIAFYDTEVLPALKEGQQYVLIVLFGRTGEKKNTPGKSIVLGTLTHGVQNSLTLRPIIDRTNESEGQLGHPLGLAIDPTTKEIYFGDIMEGRIYKALLQ